jgi:hypothetical protein
VKLSDVLSETGLLPLAAVPFTDSEPVPDTVVSLTNVGLTPVLVLPAASLEDTV